MEACVLCVMIGRNTDGADRDRTGDPLVANQVLSQLSYRPEHAGNLANFLPDLKRYLAIPSDGTHRHT